MPVPTPASGPSAAPRVPVTPLRPATAAERRTRASLALVEAYLLDRRRELRRPTSVRLSPLGPRS